MSAFNCVTVAMTCFRTALKRKQIRHEEQECETAEDFGKTTSSTKYYLALYSCSTCQQFFSNIDSQLITLRQVRIAKHMCEQKLCFDQSIMTRCPRNSRMVCLKEAGRKVVLHRRDRQVEYGRCIKTARIEQN